MATGPPETRPEERAAVIEDHLGAPTREETAVANVPREGGVRDPLRLFS